MNRLQKPVPTVIIMLNLKRCNLTQQLEVIKKVKCSLFIYNRIFEAFSLASEIFVAVSWPLAY